MSPGAELELHTSVSELWLRHPGLEHLPLHHPLLPQLPWATAQHLSLGHSMRPPDTWPGPVPMHHQGPGPTSLELCPILPTSPNLSTSPRRVLGSTGWCKRLLSSEPSLAGTHINLTPRRALPARQDMVQRLHPVSRRRLGPLWSRRCLNSVLPTPQSLSPPNPQHTYLVAITLSFSPSSSAGGSIMSEHVTLLLKLLPTWYFQQDEAQTFQRDFQIPSHLSGLFSPDSLPTAQPEFWAQQISK